MKTSKFVPMCLFPFIAGACVVGDEAANLSGSEAPVVELETMDAVHGVRGHLVVDGETIEFWSLESEGSDGGVEGAVVGADGVFYAEWQLDVAGFITGHIDGREVTSDLLGDPDALAELADSRAGEILVALTDGIASMELEEDLDAAVVHMLENLMQPGSLFAGEPEFEDVEADDDYDRALCPLQRKRWRYIGCFPRWELRREAQRKCRGYNNNNYAYPIRIRFANRCGRNRFHTVTFRCCYR